MEPYKAKKLPVEYDFTKDILNLLCSAKEAYGEYKGFLKNMSYDFKSFLECAFVNDVYYSFKIDNSKLEKDEMFILPYKNKTNKTIIFNNSKLALLTGVTHTSSSEFNVELFKK